MKKLHLLIIFFLFLPVIFFTGCTEESAQDHSRHSEQEKKDLYYCPMHPQVTSDKPGSCPICHMDLVKKADDSQAVTDNLKGILTLTERGEILANVSTTKAKLEKVSKQVTAFGYLDFEEPARKFITARFNGRIEKLFVDATGKYIKRGQPLFEIYSPDLVQAQNDYLIALRQSKPIQYALLNNDVKAVNDNTLLNSARKRLEIFGITSSQIKELESSGEVKLSLTYYSPYSGTVIEKKVQEGMYVSEGSVIYDIAELSTLWNISEIFADDISMIQTGDKIQLTTQSYPGEIFTGKVTFIYPVVNPESRTVRIRSEILNLNNRLKPQMYTEAIFERSYGASIAVPQDAVLFTGKRNIIWVKTGKTSDGASGKFEVRDVKVGLKFDGKYQILSGLSEGEEVAAQGGFLIDSESQLKSGMPTGHQHGEKGQTNSSNSTQMQNESEMKEHNH